LPGAADAFRLWWGSKLDSSNQLVSQPTNHIRLLAPQVANTWGVPLQQVVLDNRDLLADAGADAFLTGATVVLCGLQLRTGEAPRGGGGNGATGDRPRAQAPAPATRAAEPSPQAAVAAPSPTPPVAQPAALAGAAPPERAATGPSPAPAGPNPKAANVPPSKAASAPPGTPRSGTLSAKAYCPGAPGDLGGKMTYSILAPDHVTTTIYSRFTFTFLISCDYFIDLDCHPASEAEVARAVKGDDLWWFDRCKSGEAAWFCDAVGFPKYSDNCAGTVKPRPRLIQLCGAWGERMSGFWHPKDGTGWCPGVSATSPCYNCTWTLAPM
jgi:hypothetical protein